MSLRGAERMRARDAGGRGPPPMVPMENGSYVIARDGLSQGGGGRPLKDGFGGELEGQPGDEQRPPPPGGGEGGAGPPRAAGAAPPPPAAAPASPAIRRGRSRRRTCRRSAPPSAGAPSLRPVASAGGGCRAPHRRRAF